MLFTAGLLTSFSFFSASNSLSKDTELGVPSTICEEKRRAANKSSSIACTSINHLYNFYMKSIESDKRRNKLAKTLSHNQERNVICWKKNQNLTLRRWYYSSGKIIHTQLYHQLVHVRHSWKKECACSAPSRTRRDGICGSWLKSKNTRTHELYDM